MKKLVVALFLLCCCGLLMGAAGPRGLPAKDFMLNDCAGVSETRGAALKIAVKTISITAENPDNEAAESGEPQQSSYISEENTKKSGDGGNFAIYAIVILVALVIMLRGWRTSAKYRNKYGTSHIDYRDFTLPDTRLSARYDDVDYPSGFGGPGGYGYGNAVSLIKKAETGDENDGGVAGNDMK